MKGITPFAILDSGCSYHRIELPLKDMGIEVRDFIGKSGKEIWGNTKILFYNRLPEMELSAMLSCRDHFGFKIVLDLDDYWELGPFHYLNKPWSDGHITYRIVQGIKAVDAVIVTTERLAKMARVYNKNVHVIPNALPFDEHQFNSSKIEDTLPRIAYIGGASHARDVQLLERPLDRLNGTEARFILGGYSEGSKEWKKMDGSFSLRGKLKGYERREAKPLGEYMDLYKEADVCLAPLESTFFNGFKSNLKILEAGCKNIPIITSDTAPYCDEPVIKCSTPTDWYKNIKELLNTPSLLQARGKELGEYVREHFTLSKVNVYRRQLFESLMN